MILPVLFFRLCRYRKSTAKARLPYSKADAMRVPGQAAEDPELRERREFF
jgi:hypothetical protein